MRLMVAEPATPYRLKPPAVIDSSVLAAFVFLEPKADEAESHLRLYELHAPALLPLEIANVAMNKLRRQFATAEELAHRLKAFDFSCIQLAETPTAAAFVLAARYQLTAYDAAYLWLAGELRAPLLTFDSRLAEAARDYLSQLSAP